MVGRGRLDRRRDRPAALQREPRRGARPTSAVRRVSLDSSLYRAAMANMLMAATEVKEQGTFGYLEKSVTTPDFYTYLKG